MDLDSQNILIYILGGLFFLWELGKKIRSVYVYRRAVQTDAHKNKFVFTRRDGFILLILIPLTVFLTMLSDYMVENLFGIMALLILLIVLIIFNQQFVNIEQDIILFKDKEVRIKGKDITRISISNSEVIIDTQKYLNHYTFKSKSLRDKNWPDFQMIMEQYASQFDHITVERA